MFLTSFSTAVEHVIGIIANVWQALRLCPAFDSLMDSLSKIWGCDPAPSKPVNILSIKTRHAVIYILYNI